MPDNTPLRRFSVAIRLLSVFSAGCLAVDPVAAAGTDAGRGIQNAAQVAYAISGVAQTPLTSNVVQTFVDELVDVVVVSLDGAAVGVTSPAASSVLQFSVTNTGNGEEAFRLAVDDTVGGDDFNPALLQIYYESNGVPGLQAGTGGDTAYVPGSNEPLLLEDETVVVYVDSAIPGALGQNAEGALVLRAVSITVFDNAGTDDPDASAFPAPGTAYADAGDADDTGSGNVTAVVGATHAASDLLLRDEGRYRVSSAVVAIRKSSESVLDPFGGATLVPGSLVSYRIEVDVSGSGAAENLVVTDVIPAELEYQAGTLVVPGLPAGEEADDDFAPAGTDNTGFDAGSQTINVNLGTVAGGGPTLVITFDTAIR